MSIIKTYFKELNQIKDEVATTVSNLTGIAENNDASTEETSSAITELNDALVSCNELTDKIIQVSKELDKNVNVFSFSETNNSEL